MQKGNGWEGCVGGPDPDQPTWEKRWGAIALDDTTGAFGSSSREGSESRAEKNALATCKKQGGKTCRIEISYHNQCVSLAAGKFKYFVRADYTLALAESNSLSKCGKEDEGCKIFYSNCSLPERIQ
ncbi:DUF4189 domain-containing protein [Lysobacter yananisis]|uniref:DUF4189 domain-containing protein n=1 Tax=Lysobacter yananisis TaxID=1003114 RepID=A0ABY9P8S0_9GAMM|nr:DUF4189 domain-containing protein [Lysobacter yananisis]WMT02576.1 DUF4189 domain-containing protein [Lysobacter yananisis]